MVPTAAPMSDHIGLHGGKKIARLLLFESQRGLFFRGRTTQRTIPGRFPCLTMVPVRTTTLGVDRLFPKRRFVAAIVGLVGRGGDG